MLIDEDCFSTTDNLLRALADQHPNVRCFGRATGGGTGAPRPIAVLKHSKTALTLTVMKVLGSKNQLIEGRGTKPDVEIRWSREDILLGRDPDLDAALREARGK